MKNRKYTFHVATLFFLLTLVLAVFSWLANVYEANGVENLLSAEGLRWILSHVIDRFAQNPALGNLIVLMMGLGVFIHGGMYDATARFRTKSRKLSKKEHRALKMALWVLVLYGGVVALNVWMPWTIMKNVTGSFVHSPLSKGWSYLLSLGIGFSGMVYGFVSGRLRTDTDVVKAMSAWMASNAEYLVTLFCMTQFFCAVEYMQLDVFLGLSSQTMGIISQICYYASFVLFVFTNKKSLALTSF